ncbi:hypothetical protein [Streptomyces sp. NPDC047108]|uniref:hypothetical protein n=1 Tax=Streptomyces sp. NPDC047108 TaxID=3155025 RepID=UPI00340CFFE6
MTDEYSYQREVEELEERSATAARLFDVRRIIGGLFVIYGIVITIAGITASDADIDKAQGININLWTGLAMLALGLVFLVWLRLRPVTPAHPAASPDLPEPGGPDAGGPGAAGPGEGGSGEGGSGTGGRQPQG